MQNPVIKQRIVGAMVLIALAVIFLPMIPEYQGWGGGISHTNIPSRPDDLNVQVKPQRGYTEVIAQARPLKIIDKIADAGEEATVQQPAGGNSPGGNSQAGVADTVGGAESSPVLTIPLTDPAPDSAPAPVPDKQAPTRSWVVQVGSFEKPDNALAMRDKIRKQGMTAFSERIPAQDPADTKTIRVLVGPELSREKAEQLNKRLNDELSLPGLVRSYR